MKAVVDRIVQYANRYQLTNVETGEVLGTFDFNEVTGTVQQVGTEIDKELFDSIANDLAARVKLSGGELAETIVTFSDISGTAANVASGDTSATLWGKVKNWFSRLKALAFKNKVAAGDFEAGAIKNADVAADAAIAQSKVSGLMTDYVASISVSGRTVTYKNKNGVNMGSINTQDTTYELASPSGNGLMSATDKAKLDGIESGAQKNTVLGVKGGSESAYRTGNVNITKANIGLGNVDNTSDEDKPVSAATQTALNGKANTSGTYPNLTVGKATNADNATNATNANQLGGAPAANYARLSSDQTFTGDNKFAANIRKVLPSSGFFGTEFGFVDTSGNFKAGFGVYGNNNPGTTVVDYAWIGNSSASPWLRINPDGSLVSPIPILQVDPSKLAPSTANGWTQTTVTGTLPSAGIYMIAVYHTPSDTQPHHYYNTAILVYDGAVGSCTMTDDTGALLVSIVVKPSGIRLVNPVNISATVQSTNIYYKRIA